jgi:peptide/nickel transport system substrate-binding protein
MCAFGLSACGRAGAVRGEPGVLRIADNVDPASLNPLLAHDQDTIGYDLLVTQTLVGLSAQNKVVPVLVTRVPSRENGDISADGKTIAYHLRDGVRFADGVSLTSADVAFTFRAILDTRNPVESQDAYRQVESLTTPDARTVVIRLKHRWNAAVSELFAHADFAFGILPAHAFTSTDVTRAAWNQLPFGTGPFRVVEWQRDGRIVLEPNSHFRPRPKLRRVVFDLIPTAEASLIALRAGEVDVAEIDSAQLAEARSTPGIHLSITPINGEYMLIVRTDAPPLDDPAVRRAVAEAIDPAQIVRGRAEALSPADSFLPPVFDWYDPVKPARSPDPALVARDLEASGWRRDADGWWMQGRRRLGVAIAVEPERGTWMEVVEQEQLRRAGIYAVLKTFPAAQFNAPEGPLRRGRFWLAATQWIGGADPEQSVLTACSQRGSNGNNNSNYCNPRFEALFEDQATTSDPARRKADFIAMQRIVREDAPLIPIAFQSRVDAVSNRVTGFARNMLLYPVNAETWTAR